MDVARDDVDIPISETRRRPRPKLAIAPLLGLILLVNLSASLYQLPLNRIIERRLCRDYYKIHDPSVIDNDGDINETLCKIDDVQKSLAWVVGIMETLWIVGDFVMTIPLGFVAEKYGRRTVLWLNIVPRLFLLSWVLMVGYFEESLPLKAIIVGPCLSVLGGNCVLNSIVYALAASLTDDNVVRATYFSWTNAISYVVTFVGPGLAGATMTLNLFLPLLIGICLLLLAIPTISLLADPTHNPSAPEDEQRRPLISSPTLKAQNSNSSILKPIVKRFHTLHSIIRSHPRNLILLLISFFFTSLASSDTTLLAQFISKRYHWEFASAGYLLSAKAIVNFTLLTFVIPGILRARGTQGPNQPPTLSDWDNVQYSRICLVISVIGALAIALSITPSLLFPSLLLYSLGSALPVFNLGLLKSPSVAPKDDNRPADTTEPETHIFSIVMMVKILGSLIGAPLMAALWVKGISTGIYGIPYYVSACLYTCASVVFLGVRVQRGR
ncbi:major facilitator superfamily transporter [Annulohypoxylon maeteangense]|uniref:major facilitator superfamily transporter n=1 Tax=Annulohypoxylon maeteangense TaxID=1927788 RepID=UPI0020084CF9|nr:major facilitator superfamily transporter [Annulohypoxylon maeteangense]KAI0880476.1 major facilitator superfamily transporter [Annulohypoxylon maeteangense]